METYVKPTSKLKLHLRSTSTNELSQTTTRNNLSRGEQSCSGEGTSQQAARMIHLINMQNFSN